MKKMAWWKIFLLILGVFFLFLFSWLSHFTPVRFNSPDEAANYFWANRVASGQELKLAINLEPSIAGAVHLRSDNVNQRGEIVPGTFLGLILFYGVLGKIFGGLAIKFFTPFMAVSAAAAFYFLVKKFFDHRVAIVATLLLLVHPAWLYYTNRGLLPNVLFVSLCLIGAAVVLLKPFASHYKKSVWQLFDYSLGGLLIGLALTVRTSEIIWLGFIFVLLVIVYRRQTNFSAVFLFLVFAALTFLPILKLNQELYGNYLTSGYATLNQSIEIGSAASALNTGTSPLLPFGFHPRSILQNFWHYQIILLWWYFIPLVIGFIKLAVGGWQLAVSNKKIKNNLDHPSFYVFICLTIFAVVTGWLAIYYGSWRITDNISNQVTIGVAYARYFLPSFVLGLPIIAWLVLEFLNYFKTRQTKIIVGAGLLILFFTLNAQVVFLGQDGLLAVEKNIISYRETNLTLQPDLPANSIIVSDRSDKIFWPEFLVARFDDTDLSVWKKLVKVLEVRPVYYFSPKALADADFRRLNAQVSASGGYLTLVGAVGDYGEIYQFLK